MGHTVARVGGGVSGEARMGKDRGSLSLGEGTDMGSSFGTKMTMAHLGRQQGATRQECEGLCELLRGCHSHSQTNFTQQRKGQAPMCSGDPRCGRQSSKLVSLNLRNNLWG